MEENVIDSRVLTLVRTFKAPRKLVWEAWTQAGHIAEWWGAKGMTTEVAEMEFRPGGPWKFVMKAPDGSSFISEGVFTEIVEFEKIVFSADFKPYTEGVSITVRFEDQGDDTKFTFSVAHPTEEYCREQERMGFMNGWGSVFDNLESYLGKLTS